MRVSDDHTLRGGWGRPGTYDVEVQAAEYRLWRKEGVRVWTAEPFVCEKPETVELEARMVPLTPA